MAKTRSIQTSFLSGELSPLVKGNIQLGQYYQGMESAENVVVVPQGGVKRRGGLEYIYTPHRIFVRDTTVPTMPNGGTASNINDGDSATSTTTTGPISGSDPYVIAQYDLGSPGQVGFATILGLSIDAGVPVSVGVQFSTDGIVWENQLLAPDFKVSVTPLDIRYTFDDYYSAFQYYRFVVFSGGVGAGVVTLSEFNLSSSVGAISEIKTLSLLNEFGVNFIGVITDGNIQISTGTDYTTSENFCVPYASEDIPDIRHASTGGVTLLFHEDYPVIRLVNYGASILGGVRGPASGSFWTVDEAPFSKIPQFDFNDALSPTPVADQQDVTFTGFGAGQTYQIDVEGVLSKQITYSGDSTTDEQTSTAFNMQKNLQDMPNFGDTGITVTRVGAAQYRITIEGESADSYELFSGFNTTGSTSDTMAFVKVATGSPRHEDVWGVNRGYPRLGAFFSGRLWIGGTRDKRKSLFASKSGDLLNFDTGEGSDDEAIFVTITSRYETDITDIYAGRNLQIFTSGAEYAILESTTSPSSINVRSQTSNGSLYVPVEEADGTVIFADKNGKTLREYVYTFNEDSYTSNDITVLSSHLIKTPVSMAFLTGTSSDDANWLFIINSDGTAAVLNKLRSQDINAFTKMTLGGSIKSVTVADEDVLFVVEREINGSTVRLLERWNFDMKLDASRVTTTATDTISGFDYLEGETVSLIADGSILPERVVVGGDITLTPEEEERYSSSASFEVGLNFNVTIQPMPINTNVGSGENFLRLKKIVRMNVRVNESAGFYVDGVPVPFRAFGPSVLDSPPVSYTGIVDDVYPIAGWSRDTMPVFTCPDPTPLHIQAIEFEVESS